MYITVYDCIMLSVICVLHIQKMVGLSSCLWYGVPHWIVLVICSFFYNFVVQSTRSIELNCWTKMWHGQKQQTHYTIIKHVLTYLTQLFDLVGSPLSYSSVRQTQWCSATAQVFHVSAFPTHQAQHGAIWNPAKETAAVGSIWKVS